MLGLDQQLMVEQMLVIGLQVELELQVKVEQGVEMELLAVKREAAVELHCCFPPS